MNSLFSPHIITTASPGDLGGAGTTIPTLCEEEEFKDPKDYTEEEKAIVKDAFKRMGIEYQEHMSGHSEEPNAVNNVSPTQAFKGYPR